VSQILPLLTSTIDGSLDEIEQVLIISKNMYLEGTSLHSLMSRAVCSATLADKLLSVADADKEHDQSYGESDDEDDEDKAANGLTGRARLLMSECCNQLHVRARTRDGQHSLHLSTGTNMQN
jgi:hypothetical protein